MTPFNLLFCVLYLGVSRTVASPLATVSRSAAPPAAIQTIDPAVAAREKLHLGTAIGGALDLPTTITDAAPAPTGELAVAKDWAAKLTVTIVNSRNQAISTVHVNGAGPTPVGNPGGGVLAPGASAHFVVPAGWNGNVAINDASL